MKDKKPTESIHSDNEAQDVIKDYLQETLEDCSNPRKHTTPRSPEEQSTDYQAQVVSTTSTTSHSTSFQKRTFIACQNNYTTPMRRLHYDDTAGDDFLEDDVRREDPRKVRKRELMQRIEKDKSSTTSLGNKKPRTFFGMPVVTHEKQQGQRKRATKAAAIAKKHPAPVYAVTVPKTKQAATSNTSFLSSSPTSCTRSKYRSYCLHCGNIASMCHNNKYNSYCMKASYYYLHDESHAWEEGFSPERMEMVFSTAYKEIRRTDLELRFCYYENDLLEVPRCMYTYMENAVNLGYNPYIMDTIKEKNDSNKIEFEKAKSDHRG